MPFAASATLILRLLQQVEDAAHIEPPLFQIETLLQTAALLPPKTYSQPRREILAEITRLLPSIRHPESRHVLTTRLAAAWAPQDRAEALRLCSEIPAAAATQCWDRLTQVLPDKRAVILLGLRAGALVPAAVDLIKAEPAEGAEPLSLLMRAHPPDPPPAQRKLLHSAALALAPHNAALAAEALALLGPPLPEPPPTKNPKPAPTPAAITQKMDLADAETTTKPEISRLFREVLTVADQIPDLQERMLHQAVIAIWFAENNEEAAASNAASLLHATFAATCQCEDVQCDSLVGRRECSDNIDAFVKLLREKKVDPAVLRLRHPSIAARNALFALQEALAQP
ncbi:MAG: hypothetical protein NTV52_27585 [Acidobacteria bacterium]|nr:hypothetical protein [Acidobacteriota bacterium]